MVGDNLTHACMHAHVANGLALPSEWCIVAS